MGARQKAWARDARARLILALGSVCRACGATDSLTFDCLIPTGSGHHAMESSGRMCYYRKQARQGNLGLLCGYCNSMKRDIHPADWAVAIQSVRDSAAILLLSQPPGQGTPMSPVDKRECLREAVSRLCAEQARNPHK
jgi:hypothetical protein